MIRSLDGYLGSGDYDGAIYPDLRGDGQHLGTLFSFDVMLDMMDDQAMYSNGLLANVSAEWAPLVLNSALDGVADYYSLTFNVVGAYTPYSFVEDGQHWFSLTLVDRFNVNWTDGEEVPVYAQGPVSLGRKVRGYNTWTYNTQFTAVNDVISKLEEHISVHISHHAPVIHMEKMPLLKGIEFIAPLYQYITQKQAVEIEYQTFKDEAILHFTMSPYLLKEYRNRWFVIGSCTLFPGEASTFALDRIQHLRPAPESCFVENRLFDPEHYFDHVIGVTRTLQSPSCHVELRFNADQAPYVLTKPMHTSQKLLRRYPDGSIDISLQVVHNYELEREIISYAEGVQVLQPASLRNNIQKRLQTAVSLYGENSTGNQHDFNSDSITEEIPASNSEAKNDETQHDSNSALKTKPA